MSTDAVSIEVWQKALTRNKGVAEVALRTCVNYCSSIIINCLPFRTFHLSFIEGDKKYRNNVKVDS